MSSSLAAPLFDLRVSHAFYADGRCGDFVLEPTAAADTVMRGLRLACKPFADRLRVFAWLNDERKPFASFAAKPALGFVMRLRSPTFALFTDLAPIAGKAAPVFTNSGVAAADPLALRLADRRLLATETLTVQHPGVDEAFELAGMPLKGAALANLTVAAGGAVAAVKSFDAARKIITVDSRGVARGASFAAIYPAQPPRRPDVFAEVEITCDDALLQAALAAGRPRAFDVVFAAKAMRWCYYLVTTLTTPLADLTIADTSPGDPAGHIVFGAGGRTDLSAQPDAADPVAVDLAARHPGRRIVRFVSDAAVPCRETPVKNLELHAKDNRLFAALPNPSLQNFGALRLTGPLTAPPSDVLYEVVSVISDQP